jgi:hypothetical protein
VTSADYWHLWFPPVLQLPEQHSPLAVQSPFIGTQQLVPIPVGPH